VRFCAFLATIGWAASEALMRRSRAVDLAARACATAGLGFALAHVALAFAVVYAWDHAAAVAGTAQQTAAVVGWGWRGGIYVNYAFLVLWLGDVVWWWIAPAAHAARSRRAEGVRFLVFAFMFVNAAVVFAPLPGRLIGIAAVTLAIVAAPTRRAGLPA
jgi:hypothetical protein